MFRASTVEAPVERQDRVASIRPGPHQPPAALNVLYISFTPRTAQPYLDPSTRYRCFYPVEAARSLGHRAFVATEAALESVDPALFDLVVVHRPAFTPGLIGFVRAARRAGVRLVADYDDLIFDPAYATQSSMFTQLWDLNQVMQTFACNTDALRLFAEFTVSTAPLRDHVLALHPAATVHVVPNSVPPTLWSMVAGRGYQQRQQRPFVGYFPGTATHDKDFHVAAHGVAEFCRARRVPLRIVGPVRMEDAIFRGVEVERLALQSYNDMFDTLAGCRVVLAPLAASPFNQAKSHIKLVEAALSCASCVASAIPDMAQHRGQDGTTTLVEFDGDWPRALRAGWDGFTLAAAAAGRNRIVERFGSVKLYGPLFAAQRAA